MEHPQANGKIEATNKVIFARLKKRLDQKNGAWAEELPMVLWLYHTTIQISMMENPFKLTCGSEAMILMEVGSGAPEGSISKKLPMAMNKELI